jgi:hypothetical protein
MAGGCLVDLKEETMTDYRDPNDPFYRSPNDPLLQNTAYDRDADADVPAKRRYNARWGWMAGAVFLAIVAGIALASRYEPMSRTASNEAAAPTATHTVPPAGVATPAPPLVPGVAPGVGPSPVPSPTPPAHP